jgi:hypothetical protein
VHAVDGVKIALLARPPDDANTQDDMAVRAPYMKLR